MNGLFCLSVFMLCLVVLFVRHFDDDLLVILGLG